MSTLQALWARYRNTLRQFVTFGFIGGLGVLVNQAVLVVSNVVGRDVFGVRYNQDVVNLFGTAYHIRFLHVYAIIAFFVANLFNFLLNRYWTFRGIARAPFFKEYFPFLLVGSGAAAAGLLILTWLTKSEWPLPSDVFDDSTGLRTKLYWANLIQIVLVMPINFLLNKLWTFQAVRRRHIATEEERSTAAAGGGSAGAPQGQVAASVEVAAPLEAAEAPPEA